MVDFGIRQGHLSPVVRLTYRRQTGDAGSRNFFHGWGGSVLSISSGRRTEDAGADQKVVEFGTPTAATDQEDWLSVWHRKSEKPKNQ